jgi:hypothetical protein
MCTLREVWLFSLWDQGCGRLLASVYLVVVLIRLGEGIVQIYTRVP